MNQRDTGLDGKENVPQMDKEQVQDLREYAWKYFSLHADQRMKTFYFYIVLSAVLMGALGNVMIDKFQPNRAWPLPLILSFVSFIFFKLDSRNRQLIKHAEEGLKLLESYLDLPGDTRKGTIPNRLRLFQYEAYTSDLKGLDIDGPSKSCFASYSKCFNAVFAAFGFGGLALSLIMLVSLLV